MGMGTAESTRRAAILMAFVGLGASLAVFAAEPRTESALGKDRAIAVTIDDLPVAQPSWHSPEQAERIIGDLLATLDRHGVKAVGFVNEGKLRIDGRVDPLRVGLLESWLAGGQELGNHGYDHLDLHRVEPEAWKADVARGEPVTRRLVEASGGRLRWFRHPFLHVGMSVEVQADTADFLRSHGYTLAPVTIDNSEWIYGRAYAHAYNARDEALMRRIGEDYLRYMLEVVSYYEGQSDAIIGRAIPHVLLIHAYALNADWLGPLLTALEKRGYRWITLEQALEDPVYDRTIDGWTGRGGITWLHRWAITEGVDRSVFQGEPEAPEWLEAYRP
jgi:peptidoglycan/xylan/chitin deacetylase (PgdA/CDA1 family)